MHWIGLLGFLPSSTWWRHCCGDNGSPYSNPMSVASYSVLFFSILWEFHFLYHIILFGAWLVNDGISHDWCCIWRCVHAMRVSFSLSYYIVRGLACHWWYITRLMLYLEMCPCYESFIFFIILYCSGPGLSMTVYHTIDVVSGDVSMLWEFHFIVRGLACHWRYITRLMYLEMCPCYESFIFLITLYCSGSGLSLTVYNTIDVVSGDVSILWKFHFLSYIILFGLGLVLSHDQGSTLMGAWVTTSRRPSVSHSTCHCEVTKWHLGTAVMSVIPYSWIITPLPLEIVDNCWQLGLGSKHHHHSRQQTRHYHNCVRGCFNDNGGVSPPHAALCQHTQNTSAILVSNVDCHVVGIFCLSSDILRDKPLGLRLSQ